MSHNPLDDGGSLPMASGEAGSPADAPADTALSNVAAAGGALPEDLVIPPATSAMILLPGVLDRVEDFTSSELCRIFESLGLSRDQAVFTYLHNLLGYSQREVSALVGWTERHAESIRRTLDRPRARRAIAASGLLAATAARWPGPQVGGIITLFFPECPQIAKTGLMFGSDARDTLISRRSTKRIFTMLPEIRVPADEVAAEVKRLMDSNNWGHTIEWTRAWCHDRIATRLKLAQETAELERMSKLTPEAAIAEFEAAAMAMHILFDRKSALETQRKSLLKAWNEKRSGDSVVSDVTSLVTSGLPAIQAELRQATIDYLGACWTWQSLRGIVEYHAAQAEQKDRIGQAGKYSPEVQRLADKIDHNAPELIALPGNDLMSATMRQLAAIGRLRHEGAKVA